MFSEETFSRKRERVLLGKAYSMASSRLSYGCHRCFRDLLFLTDNLIVEGE
jgi:hypothetical protein